MDEPKADEAPPAAEPEAAEPGAAEPAATEPAELGEIELGGEAEEDVNKSQYQILVKKISSFRRMSDADGEPFEIDKTALEAILDISSRLAGIQMRSRMSLSAMGQGPETYKDKQVNIRNN